MASERLSNYVRRVNLWRDYTHARLTGRPIVNLIHVGKTGGSAVKFALQQAAPDHDALLRLHKHRVTLRDIPDGEAVVFFLREPVSRFVSAFNSRQREGRPRHYYPWSEGERIAFSNFETPEALAIGLSSPDANAKRAAEDAMASIQHVRDTFLHWFVDEPYFRGRLKDVLFIGFQERLKEDFERLKQIMGLPRDLRLPDDEVASHRGLATQSRALSEEAVANLSHWYAADLSFYAACRQIAEDNAFSR